MLSIQCINITYRTTGGPATFTPLKHMKKLIIPSLTALSTVGAAFAQTPSPTPTPATPQDDITRLEAQLKVAKLEAELAAVKGTPTPATTPAPPTIIINNTVAPTVQQNTPPPVAAIIQRPAVSKMQGEDALQFTAHVVLVQTEAMLKSLPAMVQANGVDALVLDTGQRYAELGAMQLGMPYVHVSNSLHLDFSGYTPLCLYGWAHETTPAALLRN